MRNEQLKYYRDWESDGVIQMENVQTLKRYHQLNEESYNVNLADFECFYAFSKEQLNEGLARIGKTKEQIYNYGGGLIGTHDGVTRYMDYIEQKNKQIKNECCPQEVYFYEFNNHECMLDWEGDTAAIELVMDIFGEDIARTITRYNMKYSFEQLLLKHSEEQVEGLTLSDEQTPEWVWFSNTDGKAYCHYNCALQPVYLNGKQYEADTKHKWGMSAYYKDGKLYKWHKD